MDLGERVRVAVQHFWAVRGKQSEVSAPDQGTRTAVTGGKQLDGFVELFEALLVEAGIPESDVFAGGRCELPGFFRPEKRWDLVAVADGTVVAVLEFKSQVGSFGNNCNNRSEEAIGNASDIKAAYREGAFLGSSRPWTGYMMLLEHAPGSTRPIGVREPHFNIFEEFRDASYAKRYELLLTKLVREQLYDATCLLMSKKKEGLRSGEYLEPAAELGFKNFSASLLGHAIAFARTHY